MKKKMLYRLALSVLVVAAMTACGGGGLYASYIRTERFIANTPKRPSSATLQVEVEPFQNRMSNPDRVGTKRVGVNTISGPILATQNPAAVTREGVVSQLRSQGIQDGPSGLHLRGTVRDFFVDVDVDPASGRGKFRATTRVELELWDAVNKQRLGTPKTYTGEASRTASSVVDSVYEKTLNVAFTNLMTKIRQDANLGALLKASVVLAKSTPSAPTTPRPAKPSPTPPASTSLQIAFLEPKVDASTSQITETRPAFPLVVLAASGHDVTDLQVKGVLGQKAPAAPEDLRQAGLKGTGVKFSGLAVLTAGRNRIEVQATDRSGKRLNKVLTIRRQVQIDTTAPQFALLQPAQGTTFTKAPTQQFVGFAVDASGVDKIQINDNTAEIVPASRQELQSAGLSGDRGVKFLGDIELEAGNNPVKVTVEDSHGNVGSKMFTIERRK